MFSPKKINKKNTETPALKLRCCWAKTRLDEREISCAGVDVETHCLIVGHVARALLARLPTLLRTALFPIGSELIAAAHDVGKVSPTFQEKIRRGRMKNSNYIRNSEPGLEGVDPELEKTWGGHAGVSQVTAQSLLIDPHIPFILGQHHGFSPNTRTYRACDPIFGGKAWQDRRIELLENLKQLLQCDWPSIITDFQDEVLAGLTTVSDWIASGSLFDDPNETDWLSKIDQAVDDAGFIFPELQKDLSFKQIFGNKPRAIQEKLMEACREPGVYILEAPMGIGKTEAALYAAYKMMTLRLATGIYFALPTQLTSDKIHERVNQFLGEIVVSSSRHRKARLIHGNDWLKDVEMGEDGQPGGSWFQPRKRGILAPFAVGTIDQALMAVMNVKHGFVRAFGLIGKVVILDEVHSYDAYTGTLLDELVEALRKWKCTVIILSATLTKERREALLKKSPMRQEYPLISSCTETQFQEWITDPMSDVTTLIHHCHDDTTALQEALSRAEKGQQVLWIENTVQEAQDRYKQLAANAADLSADIECGLLHSRFLQCDRAAIEEKWVSLFGKEGKDQRQERGRILVGTQVLEQSLDIDADFLITHICPTDMLLQRLGRLWRHRDTPRPSAARQEAWLLSPSWESVMKSPEDAFGKSAFVYDPYILMRTLEVWLKLDSVLLPSQIRELIENTYIFRKETGLWFQFKQKLEMEKNKLQRLASIGLSQGGKTLPDSQASTRYCEEETLDVLLVRQLRTSDQETRITFLDGKEVVLPRLSKHQSLSKRQNSHQIRQLAVALMQNIVKVPKRQAPDALSPNQLDWLNGYLYIGNTEHGEELLRVAKVHSSTSLILPNGAPLNLLSYHPILGYQLSKERL